MAENAVGTDVVSRVMTVMDLEATLSDWLNVPVSNLTSDWRAERLGALEAHLHAHILGQDEAIGQFLRDFKKAVVLGRGASDDRPMINMLCVGPSGVGKTEMGRRIAEFVFGDSPSRFLLVNCAQFSEEHTLSAFWGAPPGYVGYGQPTILDEIRKNPFSLVLFDEIEKMHPRAVTDLLVGLLGDGTLRDLSYGRLVSFAKAICLFTSNLGNDFASRWGHHIGYRGPNELRDPNEQSDTSSWKALEEFFRPEILGRFDSICIFNHLTEDALTRIVDLELDTLSRERLGGDRIVLLPLARRIILREAASDDFGARNLKRVLKERVEGGITSRILEGAIHRIGNETIYIDVGDDGQFTYEVRDATA